MKVQRQPGDNASLQLIDTGQLARYLRVSKATVYKLAKTGRIPYFRIGTTDRDYRFNRLQVLDALRERRGA